MSDVVEDQNVPNQSSDVVEYQSRFDHQSVGNLVSEVSGRELDTIANTQIVKNVANQNVAYARVQFRWSLNVRPGSMTPTVLLEEAINELCLLSNYSESNIHSRFEKMEQQNLTVRERSFCSTRMKKQSRQSCLKPNAEQDCMIRTAGGIVATANCVVKFLKNTFGQTVEVKLSCFFSEKVS